MQGRCISRPEPLPLQPGGPQGGRRNILSYYWYIIILALGLNWHILALGLYWHIGRPATHPRFVSLSSFFRKSVPLPAAAWPPIPRPAACLSAARAPARLPTPPACLSFNTPPTLLGCGRVTKNISKLPINRPSQRPLCFVVSLGNEMTKPDLPLLCLYFEVCF